jgi:hypothetical protein
MNQVPQGVPAQRGWLMSAKLILGVAGSAAIIFSAITGGIGWAFGIYNNIDRRMNTYERRLALVEAAFTRTSDDVRDMKGMLNQLNLNRVSNRPEVQKWSK